MARPRAVSAVSTCTRKWVQARRGAGAEGSFRRAASFPTMRLGSVMMRMAWSLVASGNLHASHLLKKSGSKKVVQNHASRTKKAESRSYSWLGSSLLTFTYPGFDCPSRYGVRYFNFFTQRVQRQTLHSIRFAEGNLRAEPNRRDHVTS